METIWDQLRKLVAEAEQCLRAEEQQYAAGKAQYRELQALHSELLNVATGAIVQPCHPNCDCRNCRLIAVIAKCAPDFVPAPTPKEFLDANLERQRRELAEAKAPREFIVAPRKGTV